MTLPSATPDRMPKLDGIEALLRKAFPDAWCHLLAFGMGWRPDQKSEAVSRMQRGVSGDAQRAVDAVHRNLTPGHRRRLKHAVARTMHDRGCGAWHAAGFEADRLIAVWAADYPRNRLGVPTKGFDQLGASTVTATAFREKLRRVIYDMVGRANLRPSPPGPLEAALRGAIAAG